MRNAAIIFLHSFLVCVFAVQAGASHDTPLGKGWYAFKGDKARSYILAAPEKIEAGRNYPLLLALHGLDGQAESFIRLFKGQKGAEGWFIVAPQAPVRKRGGAPHATWIRQEDRPHLRELIAGLASHYPIDEKRIAVVGYSAGAHMALNMARSEPTRFFRLGLIAGGQVGKADNLTSLKAVEVFLLGAQNDGSFNGARVNAMADDLRNAGVKVHWEVMAGMDHASIYNHAEQMARWIFGAGVEDEENINK